MVKVDPNDKTGITPIYNNVFMSAYLTNKNPGHNSKYFPSDHAEMGVNMQPGDIGSVDTKA
jgi:hypothetical protein